MGDLGEERNLAERKISSFAAKRFPINCYSANYDKILRQF